MTQRPLGVTILAILWILAGLVLLFGGLSTALVGGLAFGAVGGLLGIVWIIWGIVELAIGIGSWQGWPWVWTVGIVLAVLSVLMALYSLVTQGWTHLLSLIIAGIILNYLFTPDVKAWFKRT